MHVTIGICTHNRASLLNATLGRFLDLACPVGATWEMVVVTNACSDTTSLVLSTFVGRLPLRVIEESTPGLSHARNAVVRAATGDYLIWTDDDVLIERDWLIAYVRAFRAHPESAFFGGPIEPVFESVPPSWIVELLPAIGAVFARRELGDRVCQLDADTLPYGANYAVATPIQRMYPYDGAFGQRPGRVAVGEETLVLFSMLNDGHTGWWVPEAGVRHYIPIARQSWQYIRAHWRAQGEAIARQIETAAAPHAFGRPLWLWRTMLSAQLRYLMRRATCPRIEWIRDRAHAQIAWSALKATRPAGRAAVE